MPLRDSTRYLRFDPSGLLASHRCDMKVEPLTTMRSSVSHVNVIGQSSVRRHYKLAGVPQVRWLHPSNPAKEPDSCFAPDEVLRSGALPVRVDVDPACCPSVRAA